MTVKQKIMSIISVSDEFQGISQRQLERIVDHILKTKNSFKAYDFANKQTKGKLSPQQFNTIVDVINEVIDNE